MAHVMFYEIYITFTDMHKEMLSCISNLLEKQSFSFYIVQPRQ